MNLFSKICGLVQEQTIKLTRNMIDANSSLSKRMVDYSEKPLNWLKDSIKK